MSYPPPPASPPEPKSGRGRRTTIIVVAIVLAVVLLCCVGAAGVGFWLYQTISAATTPVRDAASAHLDALRAGDHAEAYQRLCAQQQALLTEAEFVDRESAGPQITEYDIVGTTVSSTNGQATGVVTVDITDDSGAERQEVITLVEENGQWRVC
ncbi:DUF4878 domain-containing protein [Solwaraspora sp. WMMD791]|uniref:Rv0361 family membrane protein n=1 Tax=Solwaraspora sp. WMMD791 TaxID=3016086 RepID=UPI00249BC48A|nr:DUF4878 domain-containing protein [Solwaraspora sp. WMMD791]WFE27723.1 DUF4878 domain-containing protein [Solwaraspora sp. WMMD791]